jgi:glycosyltransferase involved in cell wall biosynthesis
MISILLTTYNDATSLPKTLKSIIYQSYKNFELLLVDDGSIDETSLVVEKFNDKRIRYIKIEHRGRSGALNYGLKVAKFDWVFLIDADDLILPDTLEKYSKYITYPQNTVISSFACFYENDKLVFYLDYPIQDREIKKFLYLHSINNTVLYNRNFILQRMNGYNESIISSEEDYELWLRAFNHFSFIIIPEYLVVKGFRYDSFSMRTSFLKREKVYLLQRNFYNRMNISSINQDYELLGWRELFYGNKSEARKTFYKLGFRILKKPKILLAILFSNLPDKLLSRILLFNYYPRILYRIKYFSGSFAFIRQYFKKIYM